MFVTEPGVDNTNKITSAKSQSDSDALLDYLSGGNSLKVTVTPYSESEVTVSFALDGLEGRLAELKSECGLS